MEIVLSFDLSFAVSFDSREDSQTAVFSCG